jgi:7-keto-8-aminopelargonate synthetase-like enzyme
MGQHPKVIGAMVEAATRMGAGAGGTRNISGNNHPLVELERELAGLHGKEAALVFTSGYLSNETGIATIAKLLPNSVILSDVWNHNSMAATWPLATFAQSPERMLRIGFVMAYAEGDPNGPIPAQAFL